MSLAATASGHPALHPLRTALEWGRSPTLGQRNCRGCRWILLFSQPARDDQLETTRCGERNPAVATR